MTRRGLVAGLASLTGAACIGGRTRTEPELARPLLRVLGTAQDGGVPHAACTCEHCEAARVDPTRRRRVASLGLAGADGRVALIDATPDLVDQLAQLGDLRAPPAGRVDRTPLDAVFLTHAHMGHYLGLAHLGFEAVSAAGITAYVTASMADFLQDNAPWDRLVSGGSLALSIAPPGQPVAWGGLSITPVAVPHRREYTDTVGYRIAGPRKTILYIPDCAPWPTWTEPPEPLLQGVDLALLDGTFYSMAELPGRDVAETGHPTMTATMDRFAGFVERGGQIAFTHLNHSNPALVPGSAARREIEARGFAVLREGVQLAL